MPEARQAELERIILAGLPGSDFAYDRAKFLDLLKASMPTWARSDAPARASANS